MFMWMKLARLSVEGSGRNVLLFSSVGAGRCTKIVIK